METTNTKVDGLLRHAGLALAIAVLAAVFSAISQPAHAQPMTGGPDSFGYQWIDSRAAGGPVYNFEDISLTGTAVSSCDDCVHTVTLPFSFTFYGTAYTTFFISSNGFISVTNIGAGCCEGPVLPITGGVISPLWEDYSPGGGEVRYQTLGVAPNRSFIVQFTNVRHFGTNQAPVTWQAKFFEGTTSIEIHYATVATDGDASNELLGISSVAGTAWLTYLRSTTASFSSRAVKYYIQTVSAVPPEAGATGLLVSPNPFRGGVEVSFAMARGGLVRLEVYDLSGRRVRTSPSTYVPAGSQTLAWDGRGDDGSALPAGVYSLRVSGPEIEFTRRIVRLK